MPVVDVNPAGDLSVTRVRVYDSRRKQKWFDPAPSIMDTPIGSPEHTPQNLIPEPLLQDILELISENDVDRNVHRDNNDISLDMALDELGLSHADLGGICHSEVVENVDGGYYRDEDDDDDNHVTDEENLHYLDSLLQESIEMTESDCSSTNYILDNTPPPTNPPSPPEPMSEEEEESSEMYINIENSPSKTLKQAKSILEESIIIKHEPVDVEEEEEEEEEEVEEEEEEEVEEEEEDMDSGFIIRKDSDEELYDGLMIKKEPAEELFENFFPEFKERKRSSSETIKHDCMWNGVCCSKNEDFGFDDFLEFGKGTSFEVFDNFEETVVKRRRKSSEVEEPTVECEVDVEDDTEEVDVEDIKIKVEIDDDFELDSIRSACNNDHSYAMPHGTDLDTNSCGSSSGGSSTNSSFKKINFLNIKKKSNLMKGIVIKQEDDGGPGDMFYSNSLNNQSSSHQQPKKTKILVPLKDLMETLQQKSFLVAPLGPGKKVIRLTGSETVKGVLGMTPPIASSTCNQTTTITPHKKNVRKRPHPPNPPTPPMFPTQQPILPVTPPAPPKKKTKAHNNMERMRRIDLRNSFDNLKKLVPPLCKANKCSKVEILRRAEEYIRALRSLEKRLVKEELSVKCKNDSLRVRLSQLSS